MEAPSPKRNLGMTLTPHFLWHKVLESGRGQFICYFTSYTESSVVFNHILLFRCTFTLQRFYLFISLVLLPSPFSPFFEATFGHFDQSSQYMAFIFPDYVAYSLTLEPITKDLREWKFYQRCFIRLSFQR